MVKKQDKKALTAPVEQERIIESFYMLARVVDQNTQMFKAFIDMISDKEAEDDNPISPPKTKPINRYTKEDARNVLTQILLKCGSSKAKKFLDSFDANHLSQVAPANYDVFVKSGEYMIKQYGGDPI